MINQISSILRQKYHTVSKNSDLYGIEQEEIEEMIHNVLSLLNKKQKEYFIDTFIFEDTLDWEFYIHFREPILENLLENS